MILPIGESLHQIQLIFGARCLQEELCQPCRWDSLDPGIVDELSGPKNDLDRAAVFSEIDSVADDTSILPVYSAAAGIDSRTRCDVHSNSAGCACDQPIRAIVDDFQRTR